MDQEPTPTPPSRKDGKPGFFQSVNGVIAGVTGLLIAFGGLVATWDKVFPPEEVEQQAAGEAANAAQPTVTGDAAAAVPEAGDPISYKGELIDGGKVVAIDWDGQSWILTVGNEDAYSYDDTLSPDPDMVMAVSNGNYLRWPIKGGEVDESDDKVKWKTYATVGPVEPPATE